MSLVSGQAPAFLDQVARDPGPRRCKQGECRTGRSVFQPTAMRWQMLVRQWSQSAGPADPASISLPRPWQPFARNCIGRSDRGHPCSPEPFRLLKRIKAVMPRFPRPTPLHLRMLMQALEDQGPAKVERSITISPITRASQTCVPLTPLLLHAIGMSKSNSRGLRQSAPANSEVC